METEQDLSHHSSIIQGFDKRLSSTHHIARHSLNNSIVPISAETKIVTKAFMVDKPIKHTSNERHSKVRR